MDLGRPPQRRTQAGVEPQRHQVAPVEAGHETQRQRLRRRAGASAVAAHLVEGEQPLLRRPAARSTSAVQCGLRSAWRTAGGSSSAACARTQGRAAPPPAASRSRSASSLGGWRGSADRHAAGSLQNLVSCRLPYDDHTRSHRTNLSKGDFDAIEGDWLTQLEKDPSDLDYFVGVARALVGTGEEGRARARCWSCSTTSSARAGSWAAAPASCSNAPARSSSPPTSSIPPSPRPSASSTATASTYKALFEAVGLHRAPSDIPKTWEKVERLEGLLAFDVGTVVAMEGKGVGRVVEANLGLESFKVDFERIRGLTVGFKAAPKLLRPLAAEPRAAAQARRAPAALKAMAPPELLRAVLQSYDRPLTAGEIRDILAGHRRASRSGPPGGPPPASTRRWWRAAAARARPTTGPRAAATPWTRCGRRSRSADAARARSSGCGATARATRGLRDRMAAEPRRRSARQAVDSDPGLAFEIWFALERSGSKLADERRLGARATCSTGQPQRASSPASRTGCCASAPTSWCASAARTGRRSTATR